MKVLPLTLPRYFISSQGFVSPIVIGIVAIILLALGFLFFKGYINFPEEVNIIMLTKNQLNSPAGKVVETSSQQPQIYSVVASFTPLPEIELQSFPVSKEEKLVLVPLPSYGQAPITTQIPNAGYNALSNFGSTLPEPAPNFKKIAFIENGMFGLISADGKHITRLPKELKAEYITAWSPDSKKLIVYSSKQSLEDIFGGYGVDYNKQYDPQKLPGGFYLLDTEKGSITALEPINSFVNWVGNEKILALFSSQSYKEIPIEHYILFDLNTFKADAKILESKFEGYFGKQLSFSADGKKWAISLGNTGNPQGASYSNIILADFPDTKGSVIDEGTWAEVQGPIISPDGRRIIYVNHRGGSFWETTLWDGQSKKLLTSGSPHIWLNNDQFIMTRIETQEDKTLTRVFLFDIPSGNEQQLY